MLTAEMMAMFLSDTVETSYSWHQFRKVVRDHETLDVLSFEARAIDPDTGEPEGGSDWTMVDGAVMLAAVRKLAKAQGTPDGSYAHTMAKRALFTKDGNDLDLDANDVDCILQVALMGEIVFG
jgi:hypothetical protein